MQENNSNQNYSVIAGCILLLYSLCYIVGMFFKDFMYFDFSHFVYVVSIVVLSIMLLLKKNNLVIPISLGVLSLNKLFGLILSIKYAAYYPYILLLLYLSSSFFTFVSSMFLTVISLISYKKKFNDITKLWFIPIIFEFLYTIIYMIIHGIFNNIGFFVLQDIYCVGIAFVGLTLSSNNAKNE